MKREIVAAIADVLAAHGVDDPETSARDLAALTRGVVDAAGLFGETDPNSLENRVMRAVTGYLGVSARPALTSHKRRRLRPA